MFNTHVTRDCDAVIAQAKLAPSDAGLGRYLVDEDALARPFVEEPELAGAWDRVVILYYVPGVGDQRFVLALERMIPAAGHTQCSLGRRPRNKLYLKYWTLNLNP